MYNGATVVDMASRLRVDELAAYGEVEWRGSQIAGAHGGARVEHRGADYADSNDALSLPDETMVGGSCAATTNCLESGALVPTLARGYKAGGFNIGSCRARETGATSSAEVPLEPGDGYQGR